MVEDKEDDWQSGTFCKFVLLFNCLSGILDFLDINKWMMYIPQINVHICKGKIKHKYKI